MASLLAGVGQLSQLAKLWCWQALKFDLDDCRHWEFMLLTDEQTADDVSTMRAAAERFDDDVDDHKVTQII